MIIPLYVDDKKDKTLIDWVKSFTNRSANIRIILYKEMRNQCQTTTCPTNYQTNYQITDTSPTNNDSKMHDKIINKKVNSKLLKSIRAMK